MVIEIPEWKMKAKIARNRVPHLKTQGLNFCPPFWVKNSNKKNYF